MFLFFLDLRLALRRKTSEWDDLKPRPRYLAPGDFANPIGTSRDSGKGLVDFEENIGSFGD